MRVLIAALCLIVAAPADAASSAPGAPAEQSVEAARADQAARLDGLFAELKAAPTIALGKVVEHKILVEWIRSGDQEIDELMGVAVLAMDARAFTAALAILDNIVAAKPDYIEGWNKRATVYYYIGRFRESLDDIDKTLALEPRHFGALAGLGMIMADTGDKAGAIQAFERAVAVNPTLDNLKRAIEELKDSLGRDI